MAIDPIVMTPKTGAGDPIVGGNLHRALVRKALSGGVPVDQTIGNNQQPYPPLTFDEVIYDTDGFWNQGRNCFLIPKGISQIQLTAQAVFLTNGTGLRQLLVQRSDPGSNFFQFFTGVPIHNTLAVASTTTDIALTSVWLPVIEGQGFALMPLQTSGGNLAISGGGGTFFAIDAI